jgi:hypothetical protein
MRPAQRNVVLLASTAAVIKDVKDSLALIDMVVYPVATLGEAKKAIVDRSPTLILTVLAVKSDPNAGAKLAKDCAAHATLKSVPVVALLQKSDPESADFLYQVRLPVEFPRFTQQIQEVVAKASRREPIAASKPIKEPEPAPVAAKPVARAAAGKVAVAAAQPSPLRESPSHTALKRVGALLEIQRRALEIFEEKGGLEVASEGFTELVVESIKESCKEFDASKA